MQTQLASVSALPRVTAPVVRRVENGETLVATIWHGDCLICLSAEWEDFKKKNGLDFDDQNEQWRIFRKTWPGSRSNIHPLLLSPGDKVGLDHETSDIILTCQLDGVDRAEVVLGKHGLCFKFPDHPGCKPVPLERFADTGTTITVVERTSTINDGSSYEGC